jgi:cytochrome b pre-mRNA-processing protein 3
LSFFSSLLRGDRDRSAVRPLYEAAVAAARDPRWYREGGVPDTIDGRFDMVSSVLALILIRLETAGDEGRAPAVFLAETFVDDMDGTLRELGIGDVVVGKRVGKMMGALGGRVGAFRRGLAGEEDFAAAVRRNVFRDAPPSEDAVAFAAGRLRRLHEKLEESAAEQLLSGNLPTP